MQTKTIEKIIRKKITEWTATIEDKDLAERVLKSALVSGGSITSLLLNEDVNDFDVYLQDIQVAKDLAIYYSKPYSIDVWDGRNRESLINEYKGRFSDEDFEKHPGHQASSLRNLKENQIKLFINSGGYKVDATQLPKDNEGNVKKYVALYFSPNAISLSDDLQIVVRFSGSAEEIHKTFDFIHATNYWTAKEGLVLNKEALASIITKTLAYQGSMYPLTSIIRVKKFIGRKWTINAGEMLKMIYQVSLLNLNDMDVLEEQLIGIDVAYFELLIDALRKKMDSDKEFSLTPEYFNKLIDKIFSDIELGKEEQ